ncbi:DUF2924 domain-containing protein [Brevundimonas aveniformis]|uniref:DUF2924 domain-containing protein n=1 Tax=Brevundimonas aveniformis TaxID=370977 RepID=UPI001FDF177D|nr:DUF2924 domain-containing protein [Brevundimonas aveniformis]
MKQTTVQPCKPQAMPSKKRRRQDLDDSLSADLAELETARLPRMRQIWQDRLGDTVPPTLRSPEIFRRMLAYRLQETVRGGLSSRARRKIAEINAKALNGAAPAAPIVRLSSGTTLEREWKGATYRVEVDGDRFLFEGDTYGSLSEVARKITGTRWNGLLFFGLRSRPEKAAA